MVKKAQEKKAKKAKIDAIQAKPQPEAYKNTIDRVKETQRRVHEIRDIAVNEAQVEESEPSELV